MNLNARALRVARGLAERAEEARIQVHEVPGGGTVIDCGVEARGGFGAGLAMARACLADFATVQLQAGEVAGRASPLVIVATDHPVAACLASQYAGWQLAFDGFFAIGSGPMRAAWGQEELFDRIGFREEAEAVVGVLEGRTIPNAEVIGRIAESCRVPAANVTLLIAPTASLAGGIQVVARSVETALHKLAELGFDLNRVVSGFGSAPVPPVASDDLAAIGRTNDAILYSARVVLEVSGDDDSLRALGPQVPSGASSDHGAPFSEIFDRHGQDFYAVDPHLFSPAEITFRNLETGSTYSYGHIEPSVLELSFGLIHPRS